MALAWDSVFQKRSSKTMEEALNDEKFSGYWYDSILDEINTINFIFKSFFLNLLS